MPRYITPKPEVTSLIAKRDVLMSIPETTIRCMNKKQLKSLLFGLVPRTSTKNRPELVSDALAYRKEV